MRNRKPAPINPQPEKTDVIDQNKLVPKMLPSKTEKTKQTKRTKITTQGPPKIIYIAVPVEANPFRPSSPFNLPNGGNSPFGQVLGGPNQSFFVPTTQVGSNPFTAYGQPSFSPTQFQPLYPTQTPILNTNPFMQPETIQI